MRTSLSLSLSIAIVFAYFFTSCAAPRRHFVAQRPPAANDWNTEYVGRGSVRTSITNASGSSLFLKVRSGAVTAAQVELRQNGTREVFLGWGGYNTVMKITAAGGASYYRGPGFYIPLIPPEWK